jgi:hypothetical protein
MASTDSDSMIERDRIDIDSIKWVFGGLTEYTDKLTDKSLLFNEKVDIINGYNIHGYKMEPRYEFAHTKKQSRRL